jgi:hypothetical protein
MFPRNHFPALGFALFLLVSLLVGCASQENADDNVSMSQMADGLVMEEPNTAMNAAAGEAQFASAPMQMQSTMPQQTRVILKNATLGLTVEDPAAVSSRINGMAEEMGGWVVSANTTQFSDSTGENIPVRLSPCASRQSG